MSPVERCQIAGYVVIALVLAPLVWSLARHLRSAIVRGNPEDGPLPADASFRLSPRQWRRFLWLEFLAQAREACRVFPILLLALIAVLILVWISVALIDGSPPNLVATGLIAAGFGGMGAFIALARLVPDLVFGWHLVPARKALVTIHASGIVIAGRMLPWGGELSLLTHASVSRDRDLLTLQLEQRQESEDGDYWEVRILRVPLPPRIDTGALISRLTPFLRPTNYPGMYCAERTGPPAARGEPARPHAHRPG